VGASASFWGVDGGAWVVGWPFSSSEREKMTFAAGFSGCCAGGVCCVAGAGGAVCATAVIARTSTAVADARSARLLGKRSLAGAKAQLLQRVFSARLKSCPVTELFNPEPFGSQNLMDRAPSRGERRAKKPHEPRPFCFFGLDGRARPGIAERAAEADPDFAAARRWRKAS